ncbi:toprim domain-containing protein [Flavobacteriaceae bacterium MHTCC 0001]
MKKQRLTCEKARNISIEKTLESLGCSPERKTKKEAWYKSPFRNETRASFKVDLTINRWYDHGMGKGGNVIDFIMTLKNCSTAEALNFLGSGQNSLFFHQQPNSILKDNNSAIEIIKIKRLENNALINYLASRAIDPQIARLFCKEIYYKVDDKTFFSIAFKNDLGGYEMRNKYFKGGIGQKTISHLNRNNVRVVLFEGFMDFLSYLTIYDTSNLEEDYLILNSVAFKDKIGDILSNYSEILICFDNDEAGKKATKYIRKNHTNSMDCSIAYAQHKDLNAYLCDNSSKEASRTGAMPPIQLALRGRKT